MSGKKPSTPKGTRDFGPEVMKGREFIFETLKNVFRKYGFQPIETPSMEKLEVLTGKYGEEGDRLIFKILDSGDYLKNAQNFDFEQEDAARKLTPMISGKALRYDLTVPFARFVVMHQHELTFPFKRYQVQPVWRADRPQKGRYREFYQCDCDVIGSDSLINDAELCAIYDEAFTRLGFPSIQILINNRKILSGYAELAGQPDKVTDICIAIDKLDKIGEEKVRQELEGRGVAAADRIFDLINFEGSNQEKVDFLRKEMQASETGSKGVEEMAEVLDYVNSFGLHSADLVFDLKLARGLDYYTGSIYEVKYPGAAVGSLGGGGRYDDLTGIFGLNGLSGVGISFGADRIYDVMEAEGFFSSGARQGTQALIINFGDYLSEGIKLLSELRKAGIPAEIYSDSTKLKKQFNYADKCGIPYVLMLGSEEISAGKVQIKEMASGKQESLDRPSLIEKLKG